MFKIILCLQFSVQTLEKSAPKPEAILSVSSKLDHSRSVSESTLNVFSTGIPTETAEDVIAGGVKKSKSKFYNGKSDSEAEESTSSPINTPICSTFYAEILSEAGKIETRAKLDKEFHGQITKMECERLLCKDGQYLVRKSSKSDSNNYVISLR